VKQLLAEVARVLAVLPGVELGRLTSGPAPLVTRLRAVGRGRKHRRTAIERQCLKRAISWVDARFPDGGNCYRRALLEIALDCDAANERLFLGLRSDCRPMSGHAWLGSTGSGGTDYEAVISL
jgi:hypothetical protein